MNLPPRNLCSISQTCLVVEPFSQSILWDWFSMGSFLGTLGLTQPLTFEDGKSQCSEIEGLAVKLTAPPSGEAQVSISIYWLPAQPSPIHLLTSSSPTREGAWAWWPALFCGSDSVSSGDSPLKKGLTDIKSSPNELSWYSCRHPSSSHLPGCRSGERGWGPAVMRQAGTWDPLLQCLHLDTPLLKQENTKKLYGTKNNSWGKFWTKDTNKPKT